MKNAVIVIAVFFTAVGLALGQPNSDDVLNKVIARTDLRNISVPEISDLELPTAVPAPYKVQERSQNVQLDDITKMCTNGDEVVSAFPKEVYKPITSWENRRIIKVYSYKYPKGDERRIEVWYAGGDWMQYGMTYIVTNAGVDKNLIRAYLVKELSTLDWEEGSLPPGIDPFDRDPNSPKKLAEFIASDFLGANGNVREELFIKVASIPVK